MNELDIKQEVDKLLREAETKLEELFARMLKEILTELNRLYLKYSKNGEFSWTDVNKYNRLNNMLDRIAQVMTDEYRQVAKEIKRLQENTYIETYMREAYLIEVFEATDMGFRLPSQALIETALMNPIDKLTLPKILESHRNQIVRQLEIIISQALLRGEDYYAMAKEIEKQVGFSWKKAVTVARTEAGRAMSAADEAVYEQASKYTKLEKVWCSALDHRVRIAHRKLDGQKADEDGYFHYRGLKAKHPLGWNKPDMDINCRCVTLKLVNGMFPAVRRGRNYKDPEYQKKLQEAIQKYRKQGLSFAQAFHKAFKRVSPPNITVPYMTYEEWRNKYSAEV